MPQITQRSVLEANSSRSARLMSPSFNHRTSGTRSVRSTIRSVSVIISRAVIYSTNPSASTCPATRNSDRSIQATRMFSIKTPRSVRLTCSHPLWSMRSDSHIFAAISSSRRTTQIVCQQPSPASSRLAELPISRKDAYRTAINYLTR